MYTSLSAAAAENDYDGASNTGYMISDCAALGGISESANIAVEQQLTINGVTRQGYIGTARQFEQFLVNANAVAEMVRLAGYTPIFQNVTQIWSSTQFQSQYAWVSYKGVINKEGKNRGGGVVPFFSR